MGELARRAKLKSNFLIVDKGESVIVQMIGYKFVPNQQDPAVEDVMFEFNEGGHKKFWRNGSGRVWKVMDHANPGDWIKVTRNKKVAKDGKEDTTKSFWEVELLVGYNPKTGLTTAAPAIASPQGSQAPQTANPGEVVNPEDINWDDDTSKPAGPADDPFAGVTK